MSELLKRYNQSLALLRRCRKTLGRAGWEKGETQDEVSDAIDEFLGQESIEEEVFGVLIPCVRRPTGRNVPDLRGREHLCNYQEAIRTKAE